MKKYLLVMLCVIFGIAVYAQDFGFGFGDDDDTGEIAVSAKAPFSINIGGDINAEYTGFVHDFSSKEKAKAASLGDMVSGSLNFSASGANVDAYIGLNISAAGLSQIGAGLDSPSDTPLLLDEAYLRVFFGPVNVEAGYRKLVWGKADSFGPLDVINPLDYTDLTNISDINAIKIARPLVHVSWNTGSFSKLEGVFIPNFIGHRFDLDGRWAPAQYSATADLVGPAIMDRLSPYIPLMPPQYASGMEDMYAQMIGNFSPGFPDTTGLEYFQAGLRFTTTVVSADIGAQYFYGNLFQPDAVFSGINDFITDLMQKNMALIASGSSDIYTGNPDLLYTIKYNRYHQIGIDYAQVLFGFNVRAEFAAHLTNDLKGNDGSIKNPFLGWSLGFDRDLFWGINANIQCNETIRLLNNKVGSDPLFDCEAGGNLTSTRITMHLSKKFLKDALETKSVIIWDIENSDCYVIPAIAWTIKDLTAELSAGVFAGKESGDLGQYWKNSFIRLGMSYSF